MSPESMIATLVDADKHADVMLRLIDVGATQPNHAEYEAHLLKTLTVIGHALVESMLLETDRRSTSL